MANAWRRYRTQPLSLPSLPSLPSIPLLLFLLTFLIIFFIGPFSHLSSSHSQNPNPQFRLSLTPSFPQFDCFSSPQASPIIANLVEGVPYPFLISLSDFGSLPDKPHKNIVRTLKGKRFRKPEISETVQRVLEGRKGEDGVVVDVGGNVGMAAFAAAVMGFRVVCFEPVVENLQRICDRVWFNRVAGRVMVFEAVASDKRGNITFHKLVGRLDNSAVSASGAKLAFKSNEEVALQVLSIPLDDVIPDTLPVLLIMIDVQGWEYHVLKGASKILSRKAGKAPNLIYEEVERLFQASTTSAKEIRDFLRTKGYNHCTQHGTDAHCTKTA